MEKQIVLAVAGPTASGKTALAVCAAQKLGGEVISNDSMQIYRGMEIGTAAPTPEETCGIPHHMIGIAEPSCEFSCADYAEAAKAIIKDVASRGKMPILCGGTGLYLDAVIRVDSFSSSVKNDALRDELSAFAEKHGAHALHERLRELDGEAAQSIHENNIRRVIRAIEIYETTGVTKTEWDKRSVFVETPYNEKIVVLDFISRTLLYERCDKRVDSMFEAGLENEVEALWRSGNLVPSRPAYQAIGYKEFIPYFNGECPLDEVRENIKLATRHYAKRQITWFKRYKEAIVLHPDRSDGSMKSCEELFKEIMEHT